MDPRTNPYAPGAGSPPPELAGRDDLLLRAAIALDRVREGNSARPIVITGLRGVGKTVLLHRIRLDAEARHLACVAIEASEGRSLPGILVPALRSVLMRLESGGAARVQLKKAKDALGAFARGLRVKYNDIFELSFDPPPVHGVADSGDEERDLSDILGAVGAAAREAGAAAALFVDGLQYVPESQLGVLIGALHGAVQNTSPVTLIAAGLPQLQGQMGRAKSYAERLFEFAEIGPLPDQAAAAALRVPAERKGVEFSEGAMTEILAQTHGYAYFLQEWGRFCWDLAEASPVREDDARRATTAALAELDRGFFRVRFDRLTPLEKRYVRAMAELGPGPYRSGDIAAILAKSVTHFGPVRKALITKGMIYSSAHGESSFTVPLFDGFVRRIMPRLEA